MAEKIKVLILLGEVLRRRLSAAGGKWLMKSADTPSIVNQKTTKSLRRKDSLSDGSAFNFPHSRALRIFCHVTGCWSQLPTMFSNYTCPWSTNTAVFLCLRMLGKLLFHKSFFLAIPTNLDFVERLFETSSQLVDNKASSCKLLLRTWSFQRQRYSSYHAINQVSVHSMRYFRHAIYWHFSKYLKHSIFTFVTRDAIEIVFALIMMSISAIF